MPATWSFTAAQWWVAARTLGIESYPSPIETLTGVDRGGARRELERSGLLRDGRLVADLEDALRLLSRPERWIDAVWLPDPDAEAPVRILGARGGSMGVLAVQRPAEPGATRLDIVSTNSLVAALLARLPSGPAGHRAAVTVPVEEPRNPVERPGRSTVLLTHTPTMSRDERQRRAAAEILHAPHPRLGQIAANARVRGGVRRSDVLSWFDNEGDGRYVVRQRRGGQLVTVLPADARQLGEHATDLLASVSA